MSFPLATNSVDAAALVDELARFRVVDPVHLREWLAGFTGTGLVALADYLVGCGALTAFQAERVLAGEAGMLTLGPYRLTGSAGRGTFGPLYTARHVSRPGAFVLRVLPLRSLWKARQAKQLARTLAAALNHPAVAPLIEVDSANGFHYLVWPHAEGERLVERVGASGPVPPGEAAVVLGRLAGALAACHTRGTVHGVLTPHSVAIGPDRLPILLEMGIGALLAQNVAEDESLFDSMSAAVASAGVLAFAAPELADTPNAPAPAVDQYALGAVGYFALTGLPPYPHPGLADQLRAKRTGPPPSAAIVNPAVPVELSALIERMMAPAPADRFGTLGEVEERFAALAAGSGREPAPPPTEALVRSTAQSSQRTRGANSWQPGTVRPVARDDSDASITFDLPHPPEPRPAAIPPPVRSHAPETEPAWAGVATPQNAPFPPRPESAEPPEPRSDVPNAPRATPDPRLSAPAPVHWHTAEGADEPDPDQPKGPPPIPMLWKAVRRNLLFWQAATDAVAVSVFGPAAVVPGQSVKLAVYLHKPDAAACVRTLSRAFQHDAELIGAGYLIHEVPRETELAVHVSVANAGVAKTLLACEWRGQPRRIGFDLHVPWESPEGASPGLVSVGLNNVRIGKIEFRLNVLPRRA